MGNLNLHHARTPSDGYARRCRRRSVVKLAPHEVRPHRQDTPPTLADRHLLDRRSV